jgi:hypothetical protein
MKRYYTEVTYDQGLGYSSETTHDTDERPDPLALIPAEAEYRGHSTYDRETGERETSWGRGN